MHLLSASGGQIVNSIGMRIETECGYDVALDTLLVGAPLDIDKPSREVVDFLQRASASTKRIPSICMVATPSESRTRRSTVSQILSTQMRFAKDRLGHVGLHKIRAAPGYCHCRSVGVSGGHVWQNRDIRNS
jgi:hypothetical protein